MITAGIDAGSRDLKLVLYDHARGRVLGRDASAQPVRQDLHAGKRYAALLARAGLERGRVHRVVATGYARARIPFAETTVTEITCHARGVRVSREQARGIVEIGGQDSKVLHLEADGTVRDFAMNDRCAAGTGRFLEMVAERLGTDLAGLGELARAADRAARVTSMCAVFAETEIIGLLADGVAPGEIARGVMDSIAERTAVLAGGLLSEPAVFTGGVARLGAMRAALEERLGLSLAVPDEPQFTGALGAALLAGE